MYSNIDDDIFSSAMEDTEIVDNPFVQGGTDGEPLHASDAASRLLDNYDNNNATNIDQQPLMTTESPAPAPATGGNSMMGNSSLLERIQQQKKQQQTTVSSTQMTGAPTTTTMNDDQFGYPMVQEGSYSTSSSGPVTATGGGGGVHIPQYSQVPAPNPYNTDSPYTTSGMTSNSSDSIDYKEKFMSVLSVMGSAAGTVAKGAYQGGKVVYEKMTSKNNVQGGGIAASGGGMNNVTELDYQRESLLMDPHDLESSTTAMNFGGSGGGNTNSETTTTLPTGMRAGVISGNNSTSNENSFVTFLKQFAVDMKDLFLSASPRVQIGIVLLIIFIIWLIFFE